MEDEENSVYIRIIINKKKIKPEVKTLLQKKNKYSEVSKIKTKNLLKQNSLEDNKFLYVTKYNVITIRQNTVIVGPFKKNRYRYNKTRSNII